MTDRLTIDEAASELHKTRRWLVDWLRDHPADSRGLPYYAALGRTKLFHPDDIARIRRDAASKPPMSQYLKDMYELLPTINSDQGIVYFVQSGEFVKIGHSKKWPARLSGLQTASPTPLTVLHVIAGSAAKEKALHRKFMRLKAHGEWFRKEAELAAYIEMLKESGGTP